MKTFSVISFVLAVTALVSLLCVWFYPSIEDFMAGNTMWNGIRTFTEEFDAENVDTLETVSELSEHSVMVSIPYLEYSDTELVELREFVYNGGTLLLMDDYGYGNVILECLGSGMRFSNKPLLDPFFCFKNQWMPKITDFPGGAADKGIREVILNHATALSNTGKAEVIAVSSKTSYLDVNENETRDPGEPERPYTVAAWEYVGKGMVLAVSDPSVMISSMVDRADNARFIGYLTHIRIENEEILIDRSHLSKTPLDVSKIRLAGLREFASSPYILVAVIALAFVLISRYTFRKGEAVG